MPKRSSSVQDMTAAVVINLCRSVYVHAREVVMGGASEEDDAGEASRTKRYHRAVSMDTALSGNHGYQTFTGSLSIKDNVHKKCIGHADHDALVSLEVLRSKVGESLRKSIITDGALSSKEDDTTVTKMNKNTSSDQQTHTNQQTHTDTIIGRDKEALDEEDSIGDVCHVRLGQYKQDYNTNKTEPSKKANKKKNTKVQGKNKKWKTVTMDTVCSFELSLLPWRSPTCDVTVDMEKELEQFCKICDREDQSVKSETVADVPIERNSSGVVRTQKEEEERMELFDTESENIHARLKRSQRDLVETFGGLTTVSSKRLRRKKKWRVVKARKQIKTKHCLRVNNCVHGENLFINFRIAKLMSVQLDHREEYLSRMALKRLDKTRSATKQDRNPVVYAQSSSTGRSTRTSRQRAAPVPVYALSTNNADRELGSDLVNILINLQNRDLTPEDYELLLRLDERVETKTVDQSIIQSLRTDEVSSSTGLGDKCAVCMDDYILGDIRKYLPCGHCFHSDCTDQWLANATTCPLDGKEVQT